MFLVHNNNINRKKTSFKICIYEYIYLFSNNKRVFELYMMIFLYAAGWMYKDYVNTL